MTDPEILHAAAEKRALAAWEAAVAASAAFLRGGLAGFPSKLHAVGTAPPAVQLIEGLLEVRPSEALSLFLQALDVSSAIDGIGEEGCAFLYSRLVAFKELLNQGHSAPTILKVVTTLYAENRIILGLPDIELLIREYIRRRVTSKVTAVEVPRAKKRSHHATPSNNASV